VSHPTAPAPYLHFAGTAREALTFYAHVFGGSVELHTFEDFHRTDGPAEAVAHGYLKGSPVLLFAADAAGDQLPLRCEGLMLSLLGTAAASTLKEWFARLSDGGRVVDDLQVRPWGASDGQVIDRFGVHWLVGFEDDQD
jgi:PhnB protein